jgi:hypothetical protein
MQFHGLSMTPVSIKQQKVISWWKSRETQEAFNNKTGWQGSLKTHRCGLETDDTTKHEDWNLVFINQGGEDKIYPLTIIEIAKAPNKDQNLKIYYAKCKDTRKRDVFSAYWKHKRAL